MTYPQVYTIMERIEFIRTLSLTCFGASALGFSQNNTKNLKNLSNSFSNKPLKLSLAQWSLNKSINQGLTDPYEFARLAHQYGFVGLEYVTQLYREIYNCKVKSKAIKNFVKKSNAEAKKYGLENVLLMVDEEGNLAEPNQNSRLVAVENHKRWVDAAAAMGCSAIRVNLFGSLSPNKWKVCSQESLLALSDYAGKTDVKILVENHGGLSSNAKLLMEVINGVNASNCGTLPDFGNFCVEHQGDTCLKSYDKYLGVSELLPNAGAVSAKSYDFDTMGNETTIDYKKMLAIVNASGYSGYIGVEYEGNRLSEEAGILSTKRLIEKYL